MKKKQINLAVLGMGTVGTGVVKVLEKNQQSIARKVGTTLAVKRILDKYPDLIRPKLTALGLDPGMVTDSFQTILDDPEIDIVVETIGGIHPAQEMIIACLAAGKSVITANKDLLASHGKALFEAAEKHQVDLLFEASVAGGIPIIQALKESLAGNRISRIMGIVNGTTNYILTKMSSAGMSYAEALDEATALGYAESDPTNDVGGFDAARKVAILASIAFNTRITDAEVYVEGITQITAEDIAYARELGYAVKLLGITSESGNEISARVHPAMIPLNHPLSAVHDAFNAVFVEGDAVGKTMFYGQGAGELPTASAVVGDIIIAARNILFDSRGRLGCTCFETKRLKPIGEVKTKFYLRILTKDKPGVLASIATVLGNQEVSLASVMQKRTDQEGRAEVVFITHLVEEQNIRDAISIINGLSSVEKIENVIRVEDQD